MAQCTATTKQGSPCRRRAKNGEQLCPSHLGITGRPWKISEAAPKVIEALTAGNSREGACAYAGIHVATLWRWLEHGEADREQGRATERSKLSEAVIRAEGCAEQSIVAEIRSALAGFVDPETGQRRDADWRAGAWLLERRHPDRWGQRQKLEHSGSISAASEERIEAEVDRLAAEVARRAAG